MAIRLETENLKSCNAPFPKPASVVLNRTLLGCIGHIPTFLYPVIYPVTMICGTVASYALLAVSAGRMPAGFSSTKKPTRSLREKPDSNFSLKPTGLGGAGCSRSETRTQVLPNVFFTRATGVQKRPKGKPHHP